MKTLKFSSDLVPLILSGAKTSTWRLFDDKDLQAGDEVAFIDKASGTQFGIATLVSVREKELGHIEDQDMDGHERYPSKEVMLKHFREIYGDKVALETPVKVIAFRLVQ